MKPRIGILLMQLVGLIALLDAVNTAPLPQYNANQAQYMVMQKSLSIQIYTCIYNTNN
jgi:uncharacterized membrane protein YkvI